MTKWTEDEIELLREEYPTSSAKELEDELGRSANSIYKKASRLDIDKIYEESGEEYNCECEICGDEYLYKTDGNKHPSPDTCRACYDSKIRHERKERLVNDVFDGECEVCGYSKCLEALSLHHINKENKEIIMSNLTRYKWDKILEEAKKCRLLCANCHRRLHCRYCDRVSESG